MYSILENLFLEQLKNTAGKKVAFWGASTFLLRFLSNNDLSKYNVIGVLDSNPNLNGTTFLHYKVFKPENFDVVPDVIMFAVQNNHSVAYHAIEEAVNKFFPSAKLLSNIFMQSEFEKIASNKVFLVDKFGNKTQVSAIPGLNITFLGVNSIVEIGAHPLPTFANCAIRCASNSYISIGSSKHNYSNLTLLLSTNGNRLIWGEEGFVENAFIVMSGEPNRTIRIGKDCMFSAYIVIRSSDAHTLYDLKDRKILNEPTDVEIGDHVWICQNVIILKNARIPSNSVIGAYSLVNKAFEEENVVIAGNPARIVKSNVNWDRRATVDFV